MIYRLVLTLLSCFWLVMNVLLWRWVYNEADPAGNTVPPEVVWQKILTAPDSSSLSIYHHRKRVGFCHWITSVGEELARTTEASAAPEGMVNRVAGYRIQSEGNLALWDDGANRLRFESALTLGPDQHWQEILVRLNLRPATWEIRSIASEQAIRFKAEEGDATFSQVLKFADLLNPGELVRQLGGLGSLGWLGSLGVSGGLAVGTNWEAGLKWQARNDFVRVGHSPVRAYRLETRLLERYRVVIFVSRVGEILRVELPDELILLNDQLAY